MNGSQTLGVRMGIGVGVGVRVGVRVAVRVAVGVAPTQIWVTASAEIFPAPSTNLACTVLTPLPAGSVHCALVE